MTDAAYLIGGCRTIDSIQKLQFMRNLAWTAIYSCKSKDNLYMRYILGNLKNNKIYCKEINIRLIISHFFDQSTLLFIQLYDLDALVRNTVTTMWLSIIQERILGFQVEFH